MLANRVIPRSSVKSLRNRIKRSGKRLVFTNGVFDILHRGHVEYLKQAKTFGDVLLVGLNTDASVRRIKKKGRPLQNQADRAAILLALESVDYVVLFGEDTPDKLIRQVRPDVLVKGGDYRIPEIAGAYFVRSYGGRVKRVRLIRGRSTSSLIERLRKHSAS